MLANFFTIDRETQDELPSKIWCSFHNQSTAVLAGLSRSAADEDSTNQSQNPKNTGEGAVS